MTEIEYIEPTKENMDEVREIIEGLKPALVELSET